MDVIDTVSCADEDDARRPPLTATPEEIDRLLDVIERDILPLTRRSVQRDGNKVFGAAILNPDLSTSVASTNAETECPLFHGEVKCIHDWSMRTAAAERGPLAASSIFLCTHEPCCMCVASILWSGFNRIYYWLPYATTTAQGIPHDVDTMRELWGVDGYRRRNKYFASACLTELIEELPKGNQMKEALRERSDRMKGVYDQLSDQYHREKGANANNTLVLG